MTPTTSPEAEFEQLSPTAYRVSVTVPPERFERELDAAYAGLAKNAEIPGFRPGKAPRNILNRHFGKERILQETAEKVIEETFWPLIKRRELTVIGRPRIEPGDRNAGEEFRYVATFQVMPPIPEVDYEAIPVVLPKLEITDELIEEEIRKLSVRIGEQTKITDRPAREGDFVNVQFEGEVPDVMVATAEGEEPWKIGETDMEVELGRGKALEGVEKELIGMELEEIKEFELTVPEDFGDERVRGKTLKAKARLKSIREITPAELTDEFVKEQMGKDGIESFETLRERVEQEIQIANARVDERATVDQIEAYLSRAYDFPLPEGLVRAEFANVLDRALAALKEAGADIEDLMQLENEKGRRIRKRARYQAERITRLELIMREIARREAIGVADEEAANYIAMLAYRQGLKDKDLRLLLKDQQFLGSIRGEVLQKKITHFIVSKVKTERVPREEFSAMMNRAREEGEAHENEFMQRTEDPLLTIDQDYLSPAGPAESGAEEPSAGEGETDTDVESAQTDAER